MLALPQPTLWLLPEKILTVSVLIRRASLAVLVTQAEVPVRPTTGTASWVMLLPLALLGALLPVDAVCRNGCSGHGSCGLLGTCICEGTWAGRDCSFQLSMDVEVSDKDLATESLGSPQAVLSSTVGRSEVKLGDAVVQNFARSRRAAESAWATADKHGPQTV